MAKIRERERTATPEELAEHRRRWLRSRHSIADLRAGLDDTQEMPALSMAELAAERDGGGL